MIVACSLSAANTFIRAYHRHNRPVVSWLFGAALIEDGWAVAVVVVGRPVARLLDDGRTVEVTRLCAKDRARNASSRLYSWAVREAHRRGYKRILTYTRADESGVSLRASGWAQLRKVKGRQWSRPSRPRRPNVAVDKVAWIPQGDRGLWP